jgi:hypothetical protein
VALLVLYGWSTSHHPAFQPLVPSAMETAAAIAIAGGAAVVGSVLARRLADGLGASHAPAAASATAAGATSPAR